MSEHALTRQYPSLPWIAPFAVFMILLAVGPSLPIPQPWESILRVGVLVAVMLTISKDVVRSLRVRHAMPSVLLGLAVCAMWMARALALSEQHHRNREDDDLAV